ncbi:hypothetical protein V1478_014226 [Vespula squamosa]|uniref:Uncharacterized protein n=1 Tax=Vespula squamosa TaxID=30214 RepID=A0ABD2A7H5_VESSQ
MKKSRSRSSSQCITEEDFDQLQFRPTSFSTNYESSTHIFNQLRIIHPQFRPKSWSRVLEPSQNFLSTTTDLKMSEADGVDGGAIRKRGLTHLQLAEKPETPEAERHFGTRDLE